MSQPPSLAGRAAVAVVLMIGFYVLAIAMALGLLAIPVLEVVYGERIHIKLALFCVVGAGVILWSVLPRPDRFPAPGPRLDPVRERKLFAALREVSTKTGQEMPAEVYLVSDVNAWVSQRGGIMGFGSRRVMGLGLPLLRALTVDQFRAVIAHEFGHYAAGDTKLGPWIYKTREAIFRTLENLSQHSSALQKPFEWYGKLFLRVTLAISRAQERSADALAATVAGARALASGLVEVHRAAVAYDAYWESEVIPVLDSGYRPPIAEGFSHFLSAEAVAKSVKSYMEEEIRGQKSNPYDSHPSLSERLKNLNQRPETLGNETGPGAMTLLSDPQRLESELMDFLAQAANVAKLQPLRWEEAGEKVYLPGWKATATQFRAELKDLTPLAFVDLTPRLSRFGSGEPWTQWPPEERKRVAAATLGSALAMGLVRSGWSYDSLPGQAVSFRKGDFRITPFDVFDKLEKGELRPDSWRDQCERAGIATLQLEPPDGL